MKKLIWRRNCFTTNLQLEGNDLAANKEDQVRIVMMNTGFFSVFENGESEGWYRSDLGQPDQGGRAEVAFNPKSSPPA